MLEVPGNLWTMYSMGEYIAIPTNGTVNVRGTAVMGRGVALEAKEHIPRLAKRLGADLMQYGNHVRAYPDIRLFTYPVKHHWNQSADLELIERSAHELIAVSFGLTVYLPRPGCGNGWRSWVEVQPILAPILDDRFVIVELPERFW